jgi:hypothetical protein
MGKMVLKLRPVEEHFDREIAAADQENQCHPPSADDGCAHERVVAPRSITAIWSVTPPGIIGLCDVVFSRKS